MKGGSMTDLAPRTGAADTVMPGLVFNGHGAVAVEGRADVNTAPARAGPPRPRSEAPTADTPAPLTQARAALADHLAHLSQLAVEVERTAKPAERLRQQLTAAVAALSVAEAALAGIDRQHAAALATSARDGTDAPTFPPSSAAAEGAVDRARRNCNSIRQALDECQRDQIVAAANLEAGKTRFDQLALAILVEEHHARVACWARARDAYHLAEIELISLHEAIGQRGRDLESKTAGAGLVWLRQLEKLRQPWNIASGHIERGGPKEINTAASRWSAVLHRLKSDPNATF
jgi:hypothetical protein